MELESRKVFIDTQSFIKLGLNFNHPTLQSFAALCRKGSLSHLSTTVVKREVEAKISSSVEEGISSLKNFRRKARLLERIEDDRIKALFVDIDEEDSIQKAVDVFNQFLDDASTSVISTKNVNPEEIFDLYFSSQAPFGDGKKKSEFPDAFSIFALLAELGNEKAYVISDDGDMKSVCEAHPQIISIDALEKFLDLYNVHETAVAEAVKAHITSLTKSIKDSIELSIDDTWVYNEAPWEDSEVEDFQVTEVHDFEPLIVRVDDEECLITFDVDVDYEYTVSGPDFNNGIYDREEGRMYTFDTTSHTECTTSTFTVEIRYCYVIEDGEVGDIEEIDFSVLGLSDGIAVYMEEHGPEYW